MKKYFIATVLVLLFAAGCGTKIDGPSFSEGEIPYIYTEYTNYVSAIAGQPLDIELFVVPSDGSVQCSWTIYDEEIARTASLHVTAPEKVGKYPLLFTAERGGQKNYRLFTLNVSTLGQE